MRAKRGTGGRKPRRTVSIPEPLYEYVRELIEKGKLQAGYVSVDDFVRDTLRKRLRELGFDV